MHAFRGNIWNSISRLDLPMNSPISVVKSINKRVAYWVAEVLLMPEFQLLSLINLIYY